VSNTSLQHPIFDDDLTDLFSINRVNNHALKHVQIRVLQSEIHHKLQKPQGTPPDPAWFDTTEQRIQQWRSTAPEGSGFCSPDWLNLNVHSTTMMLYRPSPSNPNPSQQHLRKALIAAGGTMRVYKTMYRNDRINFSELFNRLVLLYADVWSDWLAMYQLFTAGITYLNSLWQAHRHGWSIVPSYVDALLDVQVCTSVMGPLAGE
jgi:hypothetical protein